MLDFVLVICSAFSGAHVGGPPVLFQSMSYHFPDEKVNFHYCTDRHEIFAAVFYKSYSKSADGFVFATPMYSRFPPMIWAVPNHSLSGPPSAPSPYVEAFPSFEP
jgi:hypothetical protein